MLVYGKNVASEILKKNEKWWKIETKMENFIFNNLNYHNSALKHMDKN